MNHVLLANTNPVTQSALALMLGTRLRDTAILTVADWDALLSLVEKHHPALVLLDVDLPGCTTVQGLAHLHEIHPDVKVILLGTQVTSGNRDAVAYFSCLEPPEHLLEAVLSALVPTLST